MDIIIIVLLILFVNYVFNHWICAKFNVHSQSYLWLLFFVHVLLTSTYIYMALNSPSDSLTYYNNSARTDDWFSLWGTSTTFIEFLAWPFSHFFGLSYLSIMMLFSYISFTGIVLFYVTAKENVDVPRIFKTYTAVELIFLLPNLHYWTSSLGKGAVITFGMGLFAFGLSRFNRRYIPLVLGAFIVYMVRPHILFTIIVSIMVGTLLVGKTIKPYIKWLIFALSCGVFFLISKEVAEFTSVEDFNVLNSEFIANRATELSKSGSGVNIQNYGFFMKMFTFWFRPLFFDGAGLMGIIVSFENMIYLFMFYIILRYGFTNWKHWNGYFKISIFIFLFASIALSQVTGNLGIAIRQKAQIMPFFFFIYFKALTYKYHPVKSYKK